MFFSGGSIITETTVKEHCHGYEKREKGKNTVYLGLGLGEHWVNNMEMKAPLPQFQKKASAKKEEGINKNKKRRVGISFGKIPNTAVLNTGGNCSGANSPKVSGNKERFITNRSRLCFPMLGLGPQGEEIIPPNPQIITEEKCCGMHGAKFEGPKRTVCKYGQEEHQQELRARGETFFLQNNDVAVLWLDPSASGDTHAWHLTAFPFGEMVE